MLLLGRAVATAAAAGHPGQLVQHDLLGIFGDVARVVHQLNRSRRKDLLLRRGVGVALHAVQRDPARAAVQRQRSCAAEGVGELQRHRAVGLLAHLDEQLRRGEVQHQIVALRAAGQVAHAVHDGEAHAVAALVLGQVVAVREQRDALVQDDDGVVAVRVALRDAAQVEGGRHAAPAPGEVVLRGHLKLILRRGGRRGLHRLLHQPDVQRAHRVLRKSGDDLRRVLVRRVGAGREHHAVPAVQRLIRQKFDLVQAVQRKVLQINDLLAAHAHAQRALRLQKLRKRSSLEPFALRVQQIALDFGRRRFLRCGAFLRRGGLLRDGCLLRDGRFLRRGRFLRDRGFLRDRSLLRRGGLLGGGLLNLLRLHRRGLGHAARAQQARHQQHGDPSVQSAHFLAFLV